MRKFILALALIVPLGWVQSCGPIEKEWERVDTLYTQKLAEAEKQAAPQTLTDAKKSEIHAEAEKQVKAEILADRETAAKKAAEAAANLATGNYVAGGIGILGLLGLALGIYRKGTAAKGRA
jgi:hypothetical protein